MAAETAPLSFPRVSVPVIVKSNVRNSIKPTRNPLSWQLAKVLSPVVYVDIKNRRAWLNELRCVAVAVATRWQWVGFSLPIDWLSVAKSFSFLGVKEKKKKKKKTVDTVDGNFSIPVGRKATASDPGKMQSPWKLSRQNIFISLTCSCRCVSILSVPMLCDPPCRLCHDEWMRWHHQKPVIRTDWPLLSTSSRLRPTLFFSPPLLNGNLFLFILFSIFQ